MYQKFRKIYGGKIMVIEFDRLYNKSVVWLIKNALRIEVFRGNKSDCKNFIKSRKGKINI